MARDRLDLFDGHRRLNEDHVGARRRVDLRPLDRRTEAFDGERVRARDQHQVRVAGFASREARSFCAISTAGTNDLSS